MTIDLTPAYPAARKITRVATLNAEGNITIDDQIELRRSNTVVWNMHTKAQVVVSGKTAVMSLGGASLRAEILSPIGVEFVCLPVAIPSPQRQDPGLRKLFVELPSKTRNTRITIRFSSGL